MRLLNHARAPLALFHELANGKWHAGFVETCRAVLAGEEFTVSYEDDLLFVCRCGSDLCVHKDIKARTTRDSRVQSCWDTQI
ncbi:hypothetical protein PybrP1_000521 [[Pythium] brassicae (nom. inval.)]|nr:hypothetical protein PybrP1_000521 [[Pythium] brassicae (nom. inval.)]